MKNQILLFLLFLFALFRSEIGYSDVFTLAPYRSGGKAWGTDLLGGAKLWTEPLEVNGIKTEMRLTLIDMTLPECLSIFRRKFPEAVFRGNEESFLVEIKRHSGARERIYLVDVGGDVYPVLQFAMELPEKLPDNPDWPSELPLPGSAQPVKVIEMPDRGTVYGTFTASMRPNLIYNDLDMKLTGDGWHSLGKGVFLKDGPMRIILVSAVEDGNGVVHGSVLKRNLEQK